MKRAYQLSGFHTKRRELRKRAFRETDKWIKSVKDNLIAAGGGDLSPQQTILVDLICTSLALVVVADQFLVEDPSHILNRRKRSFTALVGERTKVASHLADLLKTFGLERKARPIVTLAEILKTAPKPDPKPSTEEHVE